MTSVLLELSEAEKLATLRQLDQFREWRSLDESRYCLVCGSLFTGRQMRITIDDSSPPGRQVFCATEHCNSIPIDWVLPTNQILATVRKHAAEQKSRLVQGRA